jgi:hypothetical protein
MTSVVAAKITAHSTKTVTHSAVLPWIFMIYNSNIFSTFCGEKMNYLVIALCNTLLYGMKLTGDSDGPIASVNKLIRCFGNAPIATCWM